MTGAFTNGITSALHFGYGFAAGYLPFKVTAVMAVAFVAYQLVQKDRTDAAVSVGEMSAGVLSAQVIKGFYPPPKK